ncbi:MAG TPA: hypothetical protein VFB72_05020 [Verrucomicrobiae bacterium]|nr:hypothetical protein [Verrucomicrobiae bacterium]
MNLIAALTKRWTYSVESPGPGRVLYREGNREYTFPVFEDEGEMVLVDVPSSQRIHYFFNWYRHPQEFPRLARERILARIVAHYRSQGANVRVFERQGQVGEEFDFYPELFAARALASELLSEEGCDWFGEYSSIDILHEDYGLEICGIRDERNVKRVALALQRGFPHWHHQNVCFQDHGRDPGWAVALCMFPSRSCNSGWYDGD